MASAEARGRWRNYPNCGIGEEDYKEASTPISLPSSSSRSEGSPGDGVRPYDLPTDTKWWLRRQAKDNASSFWETFPMCIENEDNARIQEFEAVIGDTLQKKPMNGELWFEDDYFVEYIMQESGKLSSELESQWIGIKKNEPWWRTSDLNDLASFVSDKSTKRSDNCNLPRPQGNKTEQFVHDKGLASLDHEPAIEMSNFTETMLRPPTSIRMGESQYSSGAIGCSPSGHTRSLSTAKPDEAKKLHTPNSELSKSQLLEALCHSQTRAREAEKAAQRAYDEKEHMITLFLRQAAQLFAYKQWLHILQLETLCLQLRRNKHQLVYTRFPDFVPWVPSESKRRDRIGCKAAKTKQPGSPRYRTGKSIGNFLLGLALAGAGALLGWTLGWLFPTL